LDRWLAAAGQRAQAGGVDRQMAVMRPRGSLPAVSVACGGDIGDLKAAEFKRAGGD